MNSRTATLVLVVCLARLLAVADAPAGYYASAEGKTGADLRQALHVIVSGHHVIPYSGGATNTADALKVLDEDPADTNDVILIYERRSEPKTTFGLSSGWNREHLWPNSYGIDSRLPAYSDLHNLRAEDATVNSARGNKFYDRSDTNSPGYKLPGHAEAPLTSTDSDSWEPPDEVKGDIARAMFYMTVRYTGDPTNEPALFLTDATAQVSSATNFMARVTTLLAWHRADPVDARERLRNDLVCERYQGNRNPFVDRLEWADAVFRPLLLVATQTNGVRLQWPGAYVAATVEAAVTLGDWTMLTNGPTLVHGFCTVDLPLTGGQRFFRLRLE